MENTNINLTLESMTTFLRKDKRDLHKQMPSKSRFKRPGTLYQKGM